MAPVLGWVQGTEVGDLNWILAPGIWGENLCLAPSLLDTLWNALISYQIAWSPPSAGHPASW